MGITWSADMSWLGGGEAGQVVVTQVSTGIHSLLTRWSAYAHSVVSMEWTGPDTWVDLHPF